MKRTASKFKKPTVLVAMSGGVDSSVAAALLIRKGYDVTGAFMKQWSDTRDISGVCEWKRDRRDALRTAARLGIPLLTLDFEKEYRESVASYLFSEYEKGQTPNPDVLCNATIKFGAWLLWALAHGFEYVATGHYANLRTTQHANYPALGGTPPAGGGEKYERYEIENTKDTNSTKLNDDRVTYHLMSAKDTKKDQTYFLHQLNQEQLSHVLFPIGHLLKSEVRQLASRLKLPTAEREESMGICFIGETPMKKFLQQKIKPTRGNVALSTGEIVGTHEGLPFYTIGQRHFGVGYGGKGGETKPLFVLAKNAEKNELIVGYEDDPLLWKKKIAVDNVHWVRGQLPKFPLHCEVRIRHRQPLQKCRILQSEDGVLVVCRAQQRAPAPGQFAVFYKKDECLGGGVIQ